MSYARQKMSDVIMENLEGLLRGFFYKNPEVRNELDHAIEKQAEVIDSRKKVIDHAMEKQISLLE